MDGATDCAAFDETVVFLRYFKDLQDPRQQGKIAYPLDEILLLCLLAVLDGAECFTEIALFGTKKLALLRRFRPFKDGTPAHDHLGDILATLDAEQFQGCFAAGLPGDRGAGGRGGRRRQDLAPIRPQGRDKRLHSQGFGFRCAPAPRAWSGQSGGKVQRGQSDPQAYRYAGDRRRNSDDRCHGLPARHRANGHRQESRLRPRAERQPGLAAR